MHARDVKIVRDHGNNLDQLVKEQTTRRTAPTRRNFDADAKFSDRDRGHCCFVLVFDQIVEIHAGSFGIDQNIRVE